MRISKSRNKILIIGHGEIGRAIGHLLKNKGKIYYWDIKPKLCSTKKSLKDLISQSDFIFLSVPTFALKSVLKQNRNYFNKNQVIVSLSKGIFQNKIPAQILKEELNKRTNYGMLLGAMIAEEILANKPAFAVFACKNKKIQKRIQKLFYQTNLEIELDYRIEAISYLSILKNVYALILGLIESYNLGFNFHGEITKQAIFEIFYLSQKLKIDLELIFSSAGLADFFATAFNPNSSNFSFGLNFRKRKKQKLPEGYLALKFFYLKFKKYKKYLPLLNFGYLKIFKGK